MKYLKTSIFSLCIAAVLSLDLAAQTYRNPDLPEALKFLDGRKVVNAANFEERRKEILQLWGDYYIGHPPKVTPALLSAETLVSERHQDGSRRERVRLTFNTPGRVSFDIAVWVPAGKVTGASPLLLTQPRFYQIPWAEEALSRGYIVCLYPGLDNHQQEEDYPGWEKVWETFQKEYPDATWSSSLGIQAWIAGRALDYLLGKSSPYDIAPEAIGIIGHSRYGKQSLYAAAFDERIKAVVSRSSGSPTASGYRFSSRQTTMESVSDEDCPPAWVLPNLSDYLGREDELPLEGNALIATIAPRKVWLHTSYNDSSEPTFAVERTYLDAKKAFALLGVPNNLRLVYRDGEHNPITQEHVRDNISYFDLSFNRKGAGTDQFTNALIHHFDPEKWEQRLAPKNRKVARRASLPQKIDWLLGSPTGNPESVYAGSDSLPPLVLGVAGTLRDRWNPGHLKRVNTPLGSNFKANVYFDPKRNEYKGTVIWLHPWNYAIGSNESYGVQKMPVYWRLASEGYVVVTYDQFGFGDRLLEAVGFYETHPQWSLLGRAVHDVRTVVDYLTARQKAATDSFPATDPSRIFVSGYAYGAMVGLYAAATDNRIAGVASFSEITPMRTDTPDKRTGGLARYSKWHAVLPKLALFEGKEHTLPFDYDQLIASLAPRRCLVYAPLNDRFTDAADIKNAVDKARKSSKGPDNLVFEAPDDVSRFQKDQQDSLLRWLDGLSK